MKQEAPVLIVIGGGAAGFFAAINAARLNPALRVVLLEKHDKLLSKVRISGGGRCNVTHACFDNRELMSRYPRGGRELQSAFSRFSVAETIAWFAARGVELHVEDDGRMFPITNNSETIATCLLDEAKHYGVTIRLKAEVTAIEQHNGGFRLQIADGDALQCAQLIVAAGGHPKAAAYAFLTQTGHTLVPPVPSLFTFNMPGNPITQLMGVSTSHAEVRIDNFPLHEEGPLLITHWGMSGPAVLKTSAWGARQLAEVGYRFTARITWLPQHDAESWRNWLRDNRSAHAQQLIRNTIPEGLTRRLWEFLLQKYRVPDQRWADLSNAQLQQLCDAGLRDAYIVSGKTTFKEEFVTAGGILLSEVDFRTMSSRRVPGLYFAGEVLDIDGVTGGFNFQAAWTTAWIAACSVAGVPTNAPLAD